jgi:hypothetical protein
MPRDISKEEMITKLFGSREHRILEELNDRPSFKVLYVIESIYVIESVYDHTIGDIDKHDIMYMYMGKISSSYKSCHGWTHGSFLNKVQSVHNNFVEKKRFCPKISYNIKNISCFVKTFILPTNNTNTLQGLFSDGSNLNAFKSSLKDNTQFTNEYNSSSYEIQLIRQMLYFDTDDQADHYQTDHYQADHDQAYNITSDDSSGDDNGGEDENYSINEETEEDIAIKLSQELECGICYSDLTIANIGWWKPCGHVCCNSCQLGMIDSGRTIRCHICRADVTNRHIGTLMSIKDS